MNARLLTVLLVCWSWAAWAQPIIRNQVTTNSFTNGANGQFLSLVAGVPSWQAASGGGDTTGTNWITLVQSGTNLVTQMDFALVQNGGGFKLVLTNSIFIGEPTNVVTSVKREAWLVIQQPSTGTCYVNFLNSNYAYSEGGHPVNDTNNGSVTTYQMLTDPFTNGLVQLSMVAKMKRLTNSIP